MKNRIQILPFLLLTFFSGKELCAQTPGEVESVWRTSLNLSGGVARFYVPNHRDGKNYEAADMNFTVLLHRRIKGKVGINFGIGYSEKFRREPYREVVEGKGISSNSPIVDPFLDYDASAGNTRSLNIPVSIEYEFNKRWVLGLGLQGRYWFAGRHIRGIVNNGALEIGPHFSIFRKINDRLFLGITGYSSMTSNWGDKSYKPTGNGDFPRMYNQYLHFTIRYRF